MINSFYETARAVAELAALVAFISFFLVLADALTVVHV